MQDEETWEKQHASIVWQYNKTSTIFWVLCVCSLCFAALNGHHGFTSSEKTVGLFGAVSISVLYFFIEMTIPASSHLVSWQGQNKWLIRICGTLALFLGIGFSLVILQSKFAGGADGAAARAAIIAKTINSDASEMDQAAARITSLRNRVGDKSAARYLEEMKAIMATQISKRETLGEMTNECQDNKRTSKQKELCTQYESLKGLREDALTLANEESRFANLRGSLKSSSSEAVGNAHAADMVWSRITGFSLSNIQTFKASLIAMAAALLTHILWLAYGATVNGAIARKRVQVLSQNSLRRSVDRNRSQREQDALRAAEEEARLARQTNADFLAAKSTQHKVLKAITAAPIVEQPAAIQIQKFFTEQTIMMDGMSSRIGDCHDHYSQWARGTGIVPLPLDRFIAVTKDVGLGVSSDGRIIGASLK